MEPEEKLHYWVCLILLGPIYLAINFIFIAGYPIGVGLDVTIYILTLARCFTLDWAVIDPKQILIVTIFNA